MNTKRFIWAGVIVFIVYTIINWIIHSALLSSTYAELSLSLGHLGLVTYLTALFFSFMFVYVFTKGYEARGWAEGIRYGLIIGLLVNVIWMFNQHTIYPVPFSLVLQWFVYGMIQFMICGLVVATIYRRLETRTT